MKKVVTWLFTLCMVLFVLAGAPLRALDLGKGFSLGGGVKTGLEIKNSDYSGSLEGIARANEYPLTLYFASHDNDSHIGEGWLNMDYAARQWGVHLGVWAHGDLKKFDDVLHIGDVYLWAKLLDNRLQFTGGKGGGTPITSGGWLGADWLGYDGLRVFWVDPLGFSVGINFSNPGPEGIKPVDYLASIMYGAKYETERWWISLMFDNNPIYDDSEANFDGGLHRDPAAKPIGQAGNIAFGVGVKDVFAGKGSIALDGIITNIGEEDKPSLGSGITNYKISPIDVMFALKGGYPVSSKIYTEVKAKYTIKQGDNGIYQHSTTWGQLQIEPYASYAPLDFLKLQLSFNITSYLNSYYFAEKPDDHLPVGWGPADPTVGDYASTYQFKIEPALVLQFGGCSIIFGYEGLFSRDHLENTAYIDLRWSF
jgi:hypothetical protein